jgi:hypothetical protein
MSRRRLSAPIDCAPTPHATPRSSNPRFSADATLWPMAGAARPSRAIAREPPRIAWRRTSCFARRGERRSGALRDFASAKSLAARRSGARRVAVQQTISMQLWQMREYVTRRGWRVAMTQSLPEQRHLFRTRALARCAVMQVEQAVGPAREVRLSALRATSAYAARANSSVKVVPASAFDSTWTVPP